LLLLFAAAGCSPPGSDALWATLPSDVHGQPLERGTLTLDAASGLLVDDVLTELGKSRSDTAWVNATAGSSFEVDAIEVAGIDGARLKEATVHAWQAPAVIERTAVDLGGFPVSRLRLRDGETDFVYQAGSAVYVIALPRDADTGLVTEFLSRLTD
jgi:hypothetical protein